MASLRRLPNSRYWIACFTDQTGKQRQRSTKESSRTKALKIAEEYEGAYRSVRTESQARRVVATIFEEVNGAKLPWSSARQFFAVWLKRKGVETAKGTLVRYQQIVASFEEHLGKKADKDLGGISKTDVQDYRDSIASKLSSTSANIYLKVLRSLFTDAWRDDLIIDSPAAKIKTLKIAANQSPRRPFTSEEFSRLLSVADQEWRGIILTGLYTAQRLGDIARLTWDSVDFAQMEIRFPVRKTGRKLSVPIHEALKSHLVRARVSRGIGGPVFPTASRIVEAQGRSGSLSNQFYSFLVAAKLASSRPRDALATQPGRAGKRRTSELSFHSIRHMSTSMMKNAGVSDSVAMDIVGHESKAISANYTHIDDAARRSAILKIPTFSCPDAPKLAAPQMASRKVVVPFKRMKIRSVA